ncbi:MAG: sphingomyelin phosphodiesterase [Bdellovibrionales bacterium]|nr:sphingomyelin phosphodiesterase [Bdellovibrionales bacterium]
MSVLKFSLLLMIYLGMNTARAETVSAIAFNTWGVPIASYDTWRWGKTMQEIAKISPDFVGLEEVFTLKAQRKFTHKDYPYRAQGPRFFPRLISSGLRILSKHPIERKASLVFRSCKADDCLSRKGALLVVADLPSGRKINVVVTHMNARGEDNIRKDQVDQLQAFMTYYAEPNAPILLIADFNFNPSSALYPYSLQSLQLTDTWTATHPASEPGLTSDCENNHYARKYSIAHHFSLVRERIDFMLTRGLKPLSSEIIFNTGTLYSDHYGVYATFDVDETTERSEKMASADTFNQSEEVYY